MPSGQSCRRRLIASSRTSVSCSWSHSLPAKIAAPLLPSRCPLPAPWRLLTWGAWPVSRPVNRSLSAPVDFGVASAANPSQVRLVVAATVRPRHEVMHFPVPKRRLRHAAEAAPLKAKVNRIADGPGKLPAHLFATVASAKRPSRKQPAVLTGMAWAHRAAEVGPTARADVLCLHSGSSAKISAARSSFTSGE